jgi:hypothetical protein
MMERRQHPLSEEQIEDLAKKLAPLVREELQEHLYSTVGKTVLQNLFILLGVATVGLCAYLSSKGFIKWP